MTIPHQQNGQPADTRPLTYDQAETLYLAGSGGADERFSELSQRDLSARAATILRERGEFDPENNLGHRELAEAEPLTARERLEHMAIGEVLARHYRHPAMLDQAAKAGRAGSRSAPPAAPAQTRREPTTARGRTGSTACSPSATASSACQTPTMPRRTPGRPTPRPTPAAARGLAPCRHRGLAFRLRASIN